MSFSEPQLVALETYFNQCKLINSTFNAFLIDFLFRFSHLTFKPSIFSVVVADENGYVTVDSIEGLATMLGENFDSEEEIRVAKLALDPEKLGCFSFQVL